MSPSKTTHHEKYVAYLLSGLDLGQDPPLNIHGEEKAQQEHPLISLRWLIGTILTGCMGGVLLGFAIYIAFDQEAFLPHIPEFFDRGQREVGVGEFVNPNKGDRLRKPLDVVDAKKVFQSAVLLSVGNKEVLLNRTFARVSTTFLLQSAGFSDEVPAFNPQNLLKMDGADSKEGVGAETLDLGPTQNDIDVSFTSRDMDPSDVLLAPQTLTFKEVESQVVDFVQRNANARLGQSPLSLPSQLLLTRTSRASLSLPHDSSGLSGRSGDRVTPFSNIEVRMVPENVSTLAKTLPDPQSQAGEKLVLLKHGDTFEEALKTAGASKDQIKDIFRAFNLPKGQQPATEGQKLKLLFIDSTDEEKKPELARISVYKEDDLQTIVAAQDDGRFVKLNSVDTPPNVKAKKKTEEEEEEDSGNLNIYQSLYETAFKQNIPRSIIDQLVRVFANDIDFQQSIVAGDTFDALYSEKEEVDGHPALLYAAITLRNTTLRYYRFVSPEDKTIGFYDENGRSARKFLIRQPIANGRFTSGFGSRYHPILGYTRMHTGVDWAAPIGTPVFASGDGTIVSIGRESGYGNRIEIQHANGYKSTYNHLSGFARTLTQGAHVRQGQVIGYLGMTGLSTGPHLHYELLLNDNFIDPMKVKLTRTREIESRYMAAFKKEKERISGLLAK